MHGAVRGLGKLYNEMCFRCCVSSEAIARTEVALTCTAINCLLMKAYLQYKHAAKLQDDLQHLVTNDRILLEKKQRPASGQYHKETAFGRNLSLCFQLSRRVSDASVE